MILDNIKPDIQCLDQTSTLLKSFNNVVELIDNEGNNEGAYRYYDKNNMNWICSGKVTERGFFLFVMPNTKIKQIVKGLHLLSIIDILRKKKLVLSKLLQVEKDFLKI